MAFPSEMRKLALNLLDSYDARMAEVSGIRTSARQELADFRAAHQDMAHEQKQRLDEQRARLASDTTAFRTDVSAAHQAMAHAQERRLDEQRTRLASDTAAFRTDVSAAHQAMAAEQQQRLSDQQVQVAADVATMRHGFQTEQSALRAEQAEAHQVWSNFNTLKKQSRSKRYVTEKPVAEPPPAAVPAKGKITAEDLKVIRGIGSSMEKRLNQAGIFTFIQLAASTPEKLRQVLGNAARLAKVESWIAQARDLTI